MPRNPIPLQPTVRRTPFAEVLQAVRTRLGQICRLPSNQIKLAARDRGYLPHFDGDQDLVLRTFGPLPEEGFNDGSGRTEAVVRRPLSVLARTRLGVDIS